jgi:hypothetical protein
VSAFKSSADRDELPRDPGGGAYGARLGLERGALEDPACLVALYLMVEPFVSDRLVLEVGPAPGEGRRRLETAGARQVVEVRPPARAFPVGGRSVDVVLGFGRFSETEDTAAHAELLAEITRVIKPEGFCAIRVPARGCSLRDPRRAGFSRGALEALLRPHFETVDVIAQVPFVGFSFATEDASDVAVNESLFPAGSAASYFVAFCTNARERPYDLGEALWVPVARPEARVDRQAAAPADPRAEALARSELTGRLQELQREKEFLREQLMAAEDRAARLESLVGSLRRDADRYLKQISHQADTLELLSMDLERAEQRAKEVPRLIVDPEETRPVAEEVAARLARTSAPAADRTTADRAEPPIEVAPGPASAT